MGIKITILDGITTTADDLNWGELEALGELTVYDRTSPDLVESRIGDSEAVFVNKVKLTGELFEKCKNLRYVGVLATGYNIVDVVAARKRGITVCNVPAYSTDSVAQTTFALILEMLQNVALHSNSVKKGEWATGKDFSYHLSPLVELAGKTIGLVGYGSIGKAVARIAEAFGMNVLYTTQSMKGDSVPLSYLLANSDIVSVHCPLTESNVGLFNRGAFAAMKDGAYFVNTARGQLVNEADLAEAVTSGKLAGAGLDVLTQEPPLPENPLYSVEKIVLTPHFAWATKEARERLIDISVQNMRAFLAGKPQNVVN